MSEDIRFKAALAELKDAAWQFKQMIYAAHAPDGTLLASWLERTTANIRAAIPELQFKPSHERLVAAIAAADTALRGEINVSQNRSCANSANHYEPGIPDGYLARYEWAMKMQKTHRQTQCPICKTYAIWIPKTVVKGR